MKPFLAAGLTCLALAAAPAQADTDGGVAGAGVYVTPAGAIVNDTSSSAGGVIIPILFLILVAAAAAD